MFVRSDTSMAILSALPTPGMTGLDSDDMVYAIDVATRIGCNGRVLMHGGAYPHRGPIDAALAGMTEARDKYDIAAWKIYTMVPTDAHFYFDDHDPTRPQIGQRFIDHVREIGPPIICTHKGISSIVGSTPGARGPERHRARRRSATPTSPSSSTTRASSRTAAASGRTTRTIPRPQGVDRLIRSLQQAGIEPNSNVYAELGGTWWFIMRDPTAAAHVLGKLLKYVGEERVVWGTDSIWFGTPQDQIQAMRTFQISEAAAGGARLPGAHRRDQGGDLRAQLGRALRHRADHRAVRAEPTRHREDPGDAAARAARTARDRARKRRAMIAAHQAGYLL